MSVREFKYCVCSTEGCIQNIDSYRPANGYEVRLRSSESTTECITAASVAKKPPGEAAAAPINIAPAPINIAPAPAGGGGGVLPANSSPPGTIPTENTQSETASKLHALVQHIYAAQARVQLEANEIKKAQGVATSAQKSLEEAANNVRVITAALQTAQQEVASTAVRAQSAQLQLAAHDQLLFAARQKVDALSSQMVGLQVEDGVVAPKSIVNISALLAQLNEPLAPNQTPTPIPAVDDSAKGGDTKGLDNYEYYDTEM